MMFHLFFLFFTPLILYDKSLTQNIISNKICIHQKYNHSYEQSRNPYQQTFKKILNSFDLILKMPFLWNQTKIYEQS